MDLLLLVFSVILQVGIGSYILFQDVRSRLHRLFAFFMLVNVLGTFSSLLRLVPTEPWFAARLLFASMLIVFVWTAAFLVVAVTAVLHQREAIERLWRAVILPVGASALLTLIGIFTFNTLPDPTAILHPLGQTGLYTIDLEAFPFAFWLFGYQALCQMIALVLIALVLRRRQSGQWLSALLLGATTSLFALGGWTGGILLTNRLQILVPALCGVALSLHFGYITLRYRLFSTRRVALGIALDRLNDGLLILDAGQVVLDCNRAAVELLDLPKELILNRPVAQILQASPFPFSAWRGMHNELNRASPKAQMATREIEYYVNGRLRIVVSELTTVQGNMGYLEGYVWILYDITERRQNARELEQRNRKLQDALTELKSTSEAQRQLLETIRLLSAPAVPVLQGIIVLPLSGHISSDRATLIMTNLLEGIRDYEAKVAIIDITGVPNVDTSVANHLIQAARAASLMGCRPLLVGIRPEIAQVIVELGIDMGGLRTFTDLQSGVEYALNMLGRRLVS